jgi:DNA-binding transcriptional MerR regulator
VASTAGVSGQESLLRPGQVALMFGVKVRAVRAWADAQKLTVQRTPGGHRRYLEREVQDLAALLRTPATAAKAAV